MRRAGIVVVIIAGTAAGAGTARAGESDVWLLPEVRFQTFYGFGQGSMHQANPKYFRRYPKSVLERHLDRLYTMKAGCLGMRVCRYNIPVGDDPTHKHMDRNPGGSRNPAGLEPRPGEFRWDAQDDILWHARGAAERGATMLVFWNSPPHWLTLSGCSAGGADPMANNTRPGEEPRFAKHMADVIEHFKTEWGIEWEFVCPVNEPELNYWKEGGGQEGCHTDAPQTARICAELAKELARRKLDVAIQAPEMAASRSLGFLDRLLGDTEGGPAVKVITCHLYAVNDGELRKWALRARQNRRPLWISEWGDWTHLPTSRSDQVTHMKSYASRIHQGLHVMHAEAWCMWEPAFLFSEEADDIAPKKSYWAVAQWSRYVRPGMQRIEVVDTRCRTTAWVDDDARRLVIVSYNEQGEAVRARYDLSRLGRPKVVEVRRTSADEDFAAVERGRRRRVPAGGTLALELPATSVTTVVLEYDRIAPGPVANPSFETGDLTGWTRDDGPAANAGVQDNYPVSGLYDGCIHPTPGKGRRIETALAGLAPGRTYVTAAACAASDTTAHFGVESGGRVVRTDVRGGGYVQHAVKFRAGADGTARVFYEVDAARAPAGKWPWATIDCVFVREE